METIYDEVNQMITNLTGQQGEEFEAGAFSGLGWLFFHYKCSTYDGRYPRVSLKLQKNAVHVYVHAWENRK